MVKQTQARVAAAITEGRGEAGIEARKEIARLKAQLTAATEVLAKIAAMHCPIPGDLPIMTAKAYLPTLVSRPLFPEAV